MFNMDLELETLVLESHFCALHQQDHGHSRFCVRVQYLGLFFGSLAYCMLI